ncbi:hypothetical protein LP415_20560 [Polaromonas sp. P1(28)-8]|nr:hypothetical protein LP415_20560 [Polaromonas sp. P1(28)-8]
MLVVLLGLAVLSLVTASVAAMFVETEERQIERDLMHAIGALRVEVKSLHDELRELKAARRRIRPSDRPPARQSPLLQARAAHLLGYLDGQKRISIPLKSRGKYRVNLRSPYTAFTKAGQQ